MVGRYIFEGILPPRSGPEGSAGMPSTPYINFFIGDYLGDTSHLSTLEHGAYLLLIFAYYQRKGPLIDANAQLMHITRTTSAEWDECKGTVLEFFERRDGMLYHNRIDKELQRIVEISKKRKIAAGKKWSNSNASAYANASDLQCTRHAILDPDPNININISNTPKDANALQRHKYGIEGNVLLTDAQYLKLVSDLGEPLAKACIEELSTAKAMKGYKYKRDDLAIKKWVVDAVRKRGDAATLPPKKEPTACGGDPGMMELARRHYEELERGETDER
jgi:uncharacterized protein YdaU (DUF1376 family)